MRVKKRSAKKADVEEQEDDRGYVMNVIGMLPCGCVYKEEGENIYCEFHIMRIN